MASTTGPDDDTSRPADHGSGGGTRASATLPPPFSPPGNGFFDWTRRLGVIRTPGWIGGVCAGLAARLGIDPVLMRGIVVVLALIGTPLVGLVYAAAWLLLPDERDVIHAEEVSRGRFTAALAGIGALALISLLSLSRDPWPGPWYWGGPGIGDYIGELIGAILITPIVLLVIWLLWLAFRSRRTRPSPSAHASPPGQNAPADTAAGTSPSAADTGTAQATGFGTIAPEPPPADASDEELAAWRVQQEEWQRQRAAWTAEQRRSDRELAAQAARERARQDAEAAIERARIRKLTNPRISGAYGILTIGSAIVAGALAALLWPTEAGGYNATIGWAAAVFVFGAAIVVAGALRRRSGFLIFFSIVSLLVLVATTAVPSERQFLFPDTSLTLTTGESGDYVQPVGSLDLQVRDDGDDQVAEIDIWQGRGGVTVWVDPGQRVRVEAVTEGRAVSVETMAQGTGVTEQQPEVTYRSLGDGRYSSTVDAGEPGEPDAVVTIWQGRGAINVVELNE